MKKIFSISLISYAFAFLVSGVFFALPSEAQGVAPIESCKLVKAIPELGPTFVVDFIVASTNPNFGIACLINIINKIINWLFIALILVCTLLIVIAGFLWMTSGGNTTKTKTAGAMIVAALIGLVIALLARALPGVVISVVT